MSDVIFEVTKDNLETGLRGYPIGYCTTSTVDSIKGLFYSGHDVAELSKKSSEEVIYLLYFGKEATESELAVFKKDLNSRAVCKPELIESIKKLPLIGHPMKQFTCALLIA